MNGWPDLTTRGGNSEVGGGPGGYYTQADYSTIVAYAASRYITVIPEIDMPGHTNAALASYAHLNCKGQTPEPYTGTEVGFSSLCVPLDMTYTFIDDVIGQLAALTPGPYIHIGGDESTATSAADYASFINRAQRIVQAHGKIAIRWQNIAGALLFSSTSAGSWATRHRENESLDAGPCGQGSNGHHVPAYEDHLDREPMYEMVTGVSSGPASTTSTPHRLLVFRAPTGQEILSCVGSGESRLDRGTATFATSAGHQGRRRRRRRNMSSSILSTRTRRASRCATANAPRTGRR